MEFRDRGDPRWRPAAATRVADRVELWAGSRLESAPLVKHANGEPDFAATLDVIAARTRADGLEWRGCVNCLRFHFSGMSHQMSGGTAGYCRLTRLRSAAGIVRADFL